MKLRIILILTLIHTPFSIFSQTIQKYKGDFPDPNKTQNGTAIYEYFENVESHELIKNGLFIYNFKGVDNYNGFNQNISGSFKDGKKEGTWNFIVTMNDFGVQNPYYTGTLNAKTSYINGKPDGKWTYSYSYRKRNKVYSYGTLKWGEFTSESKTEISYSFKDGHLCGPVKINDNVKGITIEGAFAPNGMLDGKWIITDNVNGTTEVIEYKNSILFDSYKRNISGEIIKRISEEDKKRFDEISEIKNMTEEQRTDAGVHVDTIKTGYINDWCFELASYTNVFYEPVFFMPKTIGGETGFDGLKEIVIVRERRTPLNDVSEYKRSLQYFENGNYDLAFSTLQQLIADTWTYNTLNKTDKNIVDTFSKTCNDSVAAIIKRSSTNISYLNNLKTSINNYGQDILNSGIWKSNPFIIRNGGYYDGQTSVHNGNWFNRDDERLWSQLRNYYPIYTQIITDKYLEMREALYTDERTKNIVKYNFDENGKYKQGYSYTYDIRDSSSFISKNLLAEYNKSIELFNLILKIDTIKNEVDTIIASYDEKSIKKAFVKINDYYKNMLLNSNSIDQLLPIFRLEMTDYENIVRYLKNNNKDTLKALVKKSEDIPNLIKSMKN